MYMCIYYIYIYICIHVCWYECFLSIPICNLINDDNFEPRRIRVISPPSNLRLVCLYVLYIAELKAQ